MHPSTGSSSTVSSSSHLALQPGPLLPKSQPHPAHWPKERDEAPSPPPEPQPVRLYPLRCDWLSCRTSWLCHQRELRDEAPSPPPEMQPVIKNRSLLISIPAQLCSATVAAGAGARAAAAVYLPRVLHMFLVAAEVFLSPQRSGYQHILALLQERHARAEAVEAAEAQKDPSNRRRAMLMATKGANAGHLPI